MTDTQDEQVLAVASEEEQGGSMDITQTTTTTITLNSATNEEDQGASWDGTETATTIITLSSLMKPGNTAVVTGASSGIGRAACIRFAQAGMNVWMIDIDGEELLLAQRLCKSKALAADKQVLLAEVVDVSNYEAMQHVAVQVFDGCKACHILMNNAGIQLGGNTGNVGGALADLEVFHNTVNVNTYGPIHGCLAFIPLMKESGEPGIIINTGSKQGITMPPGNLAYNMSKAALKCYTEGLEHELMLERRNQGGKLRAALLVPGWVNTSILLKAERAKAFAKGDSFDPSVAFFHEENPQPGAWMPFQVIDFMQQELDQGRFYIVCPDNDVDREMDDLRMMWSMNDIVQNRPPLSRWHPDYKDKFLEHVEMEKNKK